MGEPIRSCVGCGARAPQRTLLRFVMADGGLAPDRGRRAPGRGAYLHPQDACWAAFVRRRGSIRSLRRTPAPGEREQLVAALAAGAGSGAER